MPVTQTSICNSALIKLGADVISSITEESKPAKMLLAIWDLKRDELLAEHSWRFAIKRVALTPEAAAPLYGYDYAFNLPNDCIRIVDTDEDEYDSEPHWVKEGNKILSDWAALNLTYVYRNTDPSSWDPMFAEAFAWLLAKELAFGLTQSTERELACGKSYERSLALAKSKNGMEGSTKAVVVDKWTNSRR